MTDQEAAEEYRQRTLKYFMRQALSEEDAEYMTSIEMRGYERGIAHERAKLAKVKEALENIAALHLSDDLIGEPGSTTYNDTMVAREALKLLEGE